MSTSTTIQENLKTIINIPSDTFDLGAQIVKSSTGNKIVPNSLSSDDNADATTYTLNVNDELVISPVSSPNTPKILTIKVSANASGRIKDTITGVDVDVNFIGIKFKAKVDVDFIAATTDATGSTLKKDECKLSIKNVQIADGTQFDATELLISSEGQDIAYPYDVSDAKKMTLSQVKILLTENRVVSKTASNNAAAVTTTLKLEKKDMNNNTNNNTNSGTNTDQKKDETKDEKTTWTDISIITTSVAAIIGVLLLAKMSFSSSNSEYNDNIKFDDYKDDPITI